MAILFQIFEFIGVDVKTIVVQPHTFGIMAAVVAGVFGSAGIPEILCAECIVGVFGAVGPVTGRKSGVDGLPKVQGVANNGITVFVSDEIGTLKTKERTQGREEIGIV